MPTGVYEHKEPWNKGKTYEVGFRDGKYQAVHKWLSKRFGKANRCENPNCAGRSKVFHYALLRGKRYIHQRSNFIQLCVSCHRLYDQRPEWIKKMSDSKRGKDLSEAHKQAIKKACQGINKNNKNSAVEVIQKDLEGKFIKRWDCITDAAKRLSISPSGITMCCRGQLKKSGGFKWNYLAK